MKTFLWRSTALMLVWIMLLACSLVPRSAGSDNPPTPGPDQPVEAASATSRPAAEAAPAETEAGVSALPTVEAATAGPYVLAVSDRYPFFETKINIGISLAAHEGQLWVGTVTGTLEEVNPEDGAYGQSIALIPDNDGSLPKAYAVVKMVFEGDYLWAFAGNFSGNQAPPLLAALDPDSGEIVRQWDLNSPEWIGNDERLNPEGDFGVSPGKIWIDNHVVDTTTFESMRVLMPGMIHYAYGGNDWMWITGEMGHSCDQLLLINTSDPSTASCPDEWPFLSHNSDGGVTPGPGSPLVLAGDRMWIGGGWSGTSQSGPIHLLEAYPTDMDEAMKATGPLASVPLEDTYLKIKMLFAGNYLWMVYTHGEKAGLLYQLDAQTGETMNSLDLVGEEGRSLSDVPQDMAAESDNLWVLTSRQLLRIKLP